MRLRSLNPAQRSTVLCCTLALVVPLAGSATGSQPSREGMTAATPASSSTNRGVTTAGGVVTATKESSASAGTAIQRDSASTAQLAGSPPACQDGAYKQRGDKWKSTLRWRYQNGSTPGRMKPAAVVEQLRRAITNIRDGQDNCGLNGRPRASSRYLGATSKKPNIFVRDGAVHCGTSNGRSTVGWGKLPGNLLGYTCYWRNQFGRILSADMRLDPSKRTVLRYPASCTYKFDLQSLATHEWGHAYGLLHPNSGHAKLTMAPLLPPCSKAPRTLGLGDWRGMRKLYGLR